MLEAIPASRLPYEWAAGRIDIARVYDRVITGHAAVFRLEGTDAAIVASIARTKDNDRLALWVEDLGGTVGFRPHRNLHLLQSVIDELAAIAARNGCAELRIECSGRRGWKNTILPKLGFELASLPTGDCMIRTL